jgi:iron complex outermembrane recepter protein
MYKMLMAGLIWLVCSGAMADQAPGVTMETVVVTASREAEKVSAVPDHITVIDSAAIADSNAQNVPELLQEQGIHVSDMGGTRRNYSVDLRGFGESAPANTLVLVDGRRVNQPDLSTADWVLIPLERIDRIEIIRGGRGSVLYGDNASGGVINIITREARETGGGVSAQYGSYETFRSAAWAGVAAERWSLDLSGGYFDSDGYRDNSANEMKDLGLSLRFDPTDRLHLHLSGGFHDDRTGLPGALKESDLVNGFDRTDTLYPDNFSETRDYYVQTGLELDIFQNSSFKIDSSLRQRDKTFRLFYMNSSYEYQTTLDTVTLSPQLVLRQDLGAFGNRLIVGLDYSVAEEDISGGTDLEKRSLAYYLHDEIELIRGLTLSGGYRHDKAHYAFTPSEPDHADLRQDVYNIGLNYAFSEGSHLYASYARSYRYPLLDEIFLFSGSIDTTLKEQTSDHYEVGLGYAASERLRLNLALFHIITRDEIFYDKINWTNTNLDGDTLRTGLEAGTTWRGKRLGLGMNYTLIAAEIDGGRFDGKEIPHVPTHSGAAWADYTFGNKLFVGLKGIYVGKRPFIADFDNTLPEQEDYFLLNAKIKYPVRFLTFFVDLNNILNEEYASFGGNDNPGGEEERAYYPSPKFNWMAGVSAAF